MSSGDSKGAGWSGEGKNFVDQLTDNLKLRDYLDVEMDYDIYVGKGGAGCSFFHHYIVLAAKQLNKALIFELAKIKDIEGIPKVVPNVREFRRDGTNPDYKITVTTTLR